jgi:autotransporter-associated beta strand protein
MKPQHSISLLTLCFAANASGSIIDFESPTYSSASPLSVASSPASTTDRPFDGQDGWSRSTSNSAGVVAATLSSGAYTAGQAIRATAGQTYIGAKSGYVLVDPATRQFTFDLQYGTGQETSVALWDDADGDGLFDQAEAQFQVGVVAVGTPYQFGYRVKNFGGTRIAGGVAGVGGNWYRVVITIGDPDLGSGDRVVTMRVVNLTTGADLDFDPAVLGAQPWVTTVTAANFGTAPESCEGVAIRVTNNNAAIDNINGPIPPLPPPLAAWDGGADPDGKWSSAANWVGDVIPAAGISLLFPNAPVPGSVNDLAAGTMFAGIDFDSTAPAYVIAGNPITLGGNLVNNSSNVQKLQLGLQLDAPRNFIASGTFSYLLVEGPVTGIGGILKSGAGDLELSGTNTYTGGLTVSSGVVTLYNNQTGATGSLVVGPLSANNTNLTLETGSTAAVAAGNQVQVGNTLASGTAIQSLTVRGTMTNDGTLYVGRSATMNTRTGGSWTQNGAMTVEGLGGYGSTLTVGLDGTFTYAGIGPVVLKSGTNDTGRGRITVDGGTFIIGQAFDYDSASTFTGRLTLSNAGTLKLSAPVGTLASDIQVVVGPGSGSIDTNGHSTSVAVPITGPGDLVKAGGGVLTLSAATAHTGTTTVNGGTLKLDQPGLADFAALIVETGAQLDLGFAGLDRVDYLYLGADLDAKPPGKYGRIGSIAALGADFESPLLTGDGLLVVGPLTGFAGWALDFGLAGLPDDDFDSDGLADAVEYVLGTNPKESTANVMAASAVGDNLVFTFPRDDASETADTTLKVELGSSLASWPLVLNVGANSASSSEGVVVTENDTSPDTITVTVAKSGAPTKFARLKVTVTP